MGNLLSRAGDCTGFYVGNEYVVVLVATSELEQWAYVTADDARFLGQLTAGGVAQCFTAVRFATGQNPVCAGAGDQKNPVTAFAEDGCTFFHGWASMAVNIKKPPLRGGEMESV